MKARSLARFAGLFAASAFASLVSAQQGVVPVNPTPGADTIVHAMNNHGQVVGTQIIVTGKSKVVTAFLFDGTIHNLPSTAFATEATGINDSGIIVGYTSETNGVTRIVQLTLSGAIDLGLSLPGFPGPINNSNNFLLGNKLVNFDSHAVVKTFTFTPSLLNDNNTVAGGNASIAFVDFGGGAMPATSLLPPAPGGLSYDSVTITALGPHDEVAGYGSGGGRSGSFSFAFIWRPSTGAEMLPFGTFVNSFNGTGDYVGSFYWQAGVQTNFEDVIGPGIYSVNRGTIVNNLGQMVFDGNSRVVGELGPFFFDPANQYKNDPTVIISNTDTVPFDGQPHPATAQTIGFDGVLLADPTITYNPGGDNPPTAPGTYEVTANYPGSKFYNSASATASITIQGTQTAVNVNVQGGTFTYDGTPHAATATVTDSSNNQPVVTPVATITYSPGGATPPVYPGTYQVTATYDGDEQHLAGSGTATIVITNATVTLTVDNKVMSLHGPVPALTGTITGAVVGDGITASFSTTATSSSGVSEIPITGILNVPFARAAYYDVVIVPGTMAVKYASTTGILQPVNADGSSVFKQGSTVPIKFKVFDANGVSIGTPGVIADFRLVQVVHGTVSTTVNETVASTTPDSSFRWDGSQWIFNVSTKSYSADNTYFFLITLNDGTTIAFRFGLR